MTFYLECENTDRLLAGYMVALRLLHWVVRCILYFPDIKKSSRSYSISLNPVLLE